MNKQELKPCSRIKGKWVGSDTQCGIACSICGVAVDDFCHSADYIDLDYEPNFCPNCGADMRKKREKMRLIDADAMIKFCAARRYPLNIDVINMQPEYEPVTAEDLAETMSKNSIYNFVAWHQEALTLMKEQGFVICKKKT